MTDFTTVRTVGGLLPPDLLQRIVANDPDLGGLSPRDYGLAATDRVGEAASRAWARAKAYWAAFRAATEDLPSTESGVTETRQQWLLPLLRELGYREVEFRPAADELKGRRYPVSHRAGPVPLHLESLRQSLDHAAPAASGQRRASPHALLQEYLNVSDATYGLLSNGLLLRLLRDNASITRQAYLEFDLQAMFEGGVYADFVLLYLVLHRSRLPGPLTPAPSPTRGEGSRPSSPSPARPLAPSPAPSSECWLERWRDKAESQGTRALGELRKGVEEAIKALGMLVSSDSVRSSAQ